MQLKIKKHFLYVLLLLVSQSIFSQELPEENVDKLSERSSLTIGILQGGGSLIGADFEILLFENFGVQFGAGFLGFGAGINYHISPSIRSSFLSFQYWNQGIGQNFSQATLGPNYVFRGKKWFTAQLGMGIPILFGPALPVGYEPPPLMLMYAIGAYIPYY